MLMEQLNLWGGDDLFPADLVVNQGDGYIRYYNGLQICWGICDHGSSAYDWNYGVTFSAPFASSPTIITSPYSDNSRGCMAFPISISPTGTTIRQESKYASNGKSRYIYWLAIGNWK